MRSRLISYAWAMVVVGHAQATSHLTRHCYVGQGMSHQSGRVPPHPIRIEWGKREGFLPQSFAFLQLLHLLLKQGKGEGSRPVPLPILELLPLLLLPSCQAHSCVAAVPE